MGPRRPRVGSDPPGDRSRSAATLRWLETRTAARVRAIIEERGLRSASASPAQRRPRSILAMVLEHEGPARIGAILGQLGDAALVDTRVLLADRCGSDEKVWPAAEERFASDLLLPDRIADPWLRALTTAARDASIPILLGGHSLVGPGVPLLSQVLPGKPGRPSRAISRDG